MIVKFQKPVFGGDMTMIYDEKGQLHIGKEVNADF